MAPWLLVGLGNPGPRYAGHRHNLGYMAIDAIARLHQFAFAKKKFHGQWYEGQIGDHRVFLLKPETFMNRSGLAVQEAVQFLKFDGAHIAVLYDELDLSPFKLRVKRGGGAGGHNGIRDIDAHIGADFWRIRLGIGHPGHRDLVSPYVLQDFNADERPQAQLLCQAVADAMPLFLDGNDGRFMNKITLTMQKATSAQQDSSSPTAG